MTPTDAIRWIWTLLSGGGGLFAIYNVREALLDHWAAVQARGRPEDVLRLQTRGEVWSRALILMALVADFVAGVMALAGHAMDALVALILSVVALIALSLFQVSDRRRIVRAIRSQHYRSE